MAIRTVTSVRHGGTETRKNAGLKYIWAYFLENRNQKLCHSECREESLYFRDTPGGKGIPRWLGMTIVFRKLLLVFFLGSVSRGEQALEMKCQLRRQRPWRYVVRAAKGRQKVVQSFLVHQVNSRDPHTPFVTVSVEKIVVANRQIK